MEEIIGSLSGREEGGHRTKELGLCSKITSHAAKLMLQDILKPINARAEHREVRTATFEQFVENVYIPVFQGGQWKDSTADTEIPQIRFHLIRAFGDITCEGMRPGEILAVRIGDVDLAEDCVWIRRRVYRGKLGDPCAARGRAGQKSWRGRAHQIGTDGEHRRRE